MLIETNRRQKGGEASGRTQGCIDIDTIAESQRPAQEST